MIRLFHLWTALALSLPLVVIGLTGSILVFQDELGTLLDPPPRLPSTAGPAHTIAATIAAAQAAIGADQTPLRYEQPAVPGGPATVRFFRLREGGPRVVRTLIDPVSLKLAVWNRPASPDMIAIIRRLHGDLLMGRAGRFYVGWLGVAMLALGISGLVLWWPRQRRWRAAFMIKRGARGFRLYRDLHGAVGIWTFLLFMNMAFTGIYLVFPQTVRAGITRLLPGGRAVHPVAVIADRAAARIDADRAAAVALAALPNARLLSITFPMRPGQPYRVSLAHADDDRGAPEAVATVDAASAALIGLTDPARYPPAQFIVAWQVPLHFGKGLGWGWRVLVCFSGVLPALFAFTGISMWLLKRRARRRAARARRQPTLSLRPHSQV